MKTYWFTFVGFVAGGIAGLMFSSSVNFINSPEVIQSILDGKASPDALSIAVQLGRLDLISLFTGLIGIAALILAFPFASYISSKCRRDLEKEITARFDNIEAESDRRLNEEIIPKIESDAAAQLEELIPSFVGSYIDLVKHAASVGSVGDDIAGSFDGSDKRGVDNE